MRYFYQFIIILTIISNVHASEPISFSATALNQFSDPAFDRPSVSFDDIDGNAYSVSVLSLEDAEQAFQLIALHKELHWNKNKNGCEMRANQSAHILHSNGIESGKIFAEGILIARGNAGSTSDKFSAWSWHVANFVVINLNGAMVKLVLDPAVAKGPLTVEEWSKKITSVPGTNIKQLYFTNRFSYDGTDRNKSYDSEKESSRLRDSALLNSLREEVD